MRTADENAQRAAASDEAQWKHAAPATFPQMSATEDRLSSEETIAQEMQRLRSLDQWETRRGFNELEWYDAQKATMLHRRGDDAPKVAPNEVPVAGAGAATTTGSAGLLPATVEGDEFFQAQHGYSMVKKTRLPVTMDYAQLDIWGERARYTKDTVFLYIVSRRRNTYAVCYSFSGKRMLPAYSAGNKGLKGGDRGFRQEGGVEVAHQVTSMYLNDLIPKLREAAAKQGGTPPAKFDVVLRILGFYNGRQGAVRAVMDRSDVFNVRYVEDITPFPNRGPRMPKAAK